MAPGEAPRWPAFDAARVVFEDEDLLAVDKPVGVACQSADPAHPDDLPHRLGRWRGEGAYLGTHQRLDREVSGVLVFTVAKRANRALAEQLEGGRCARAYVAVVRGWRGGDRRLEHTLARSRDGRTEVVGPRDRRGKKSVVQVSVLERREDRALLELRVHKAHAHAIRAQLAAEGASILSSGCTPTTSISSATRSTARPTLPRRADEPRAAAPLPGPALLGPALPGRAGARRATTRRG